jgi:hypothetical protein
MSSSMRLFCSVGKEALRVLVYIQKPRNIRGTEAHTSQLIVRLCAPHVSYGDVRCVVAVTAVRVK